MFLYDWVSFVSINILELLSLIPCLYLISLQCILIFMNTKHVAASLRPCIKCFVLDLSGTLQKNCSLKWDTRVQSTVLWYRLLFWRGRVEKKCVIYSFVFVCVPPWFYFYKFIVYFILTHACWQKQILCFREDPSTREFWAFLARHPYTLKKFLFVRNVDNFVSTRTIIL